MTPEPSTPTQPHAYATMPMNPHIQPHAIPGLVVYALPLALDNNTPTTPWRRGTNLTQNQSAARALKF